VSLKEEERCVLGRGLPPPRAGWETAAKPLHYLQTLSSCVRWEGLQSTCTKSS
jgi:hypothetical protein